MRRKHQPYHQTKVQLGETTTSSGSKEAGTQTGLSEEEEEAHYKDEYRNDVIKLLKDISEDICKLKYRVRA